MKSLAFSLLTVASLVAFADDPAQKTPQQLKAEREERRVKAMNESGGFIADPRQANGKFVFVNAQKSVGKDVLNVAAHKIQNACLVLTEVVDGEKVDCKTADAAFVKLNAKMAAFLIEEAGLPMTIQCPESRWALINVAALKKDNPSKDVLDARVRKMMSRTMAMMFQAGYSVSANSTVQPITTVAQLDKIPGEGVATDCQTVIQQTASKFDFEIMKRTLYRKALDEGWAPEPVTEIQKNCKKLWEQQRRGEPTDPLKIQFDAKTGGEVK